MDEARIPTEQELDWITRRAVAEIIPYDEFVRLLSSGRSLRLKMGFDPSAPDLTVGHAVGLRKLRQLQELGHRVVIIVGDWTARIGDPSGQSKTRPMLTEEQVKANAETYLKQFFRIVDREMTEVRWQSEWFNPFTLTEVVRLAAKFTVAQMLERADFAERFAAQKPISIHELLYPLLQAYDSVAVEADVEFGGTDQKFNLMVGRELQPDFEQKAQVVYTVPLLVGTDGEIKMSKSLGNYVAVEDAPNEMYGKLMSLPDKQVATYIELLTDVPDDELDAIRKSIEERTVNPRDQKMRMAREVVTGFHGAEAAQGAEDAFVRTFSKREVPEEVVPWGIHREGLVRFVMQLKQEFLVSTHTMSTRSLGGESEEVLSRHSYNLPMIFHSAHITDTRQEALQLIASQSVRQTRGGDKVTVVGDLVELADGDEFIVGQVRLQVVDGKYEPPSGTVIDFKMSLEEDYRRKDELISLPMIFHAARVAHSTSDGTRLIKSGAVKRMATGSTLSDPNVPELADGEIFKVGRHFIRIVDADRS